MESWRVKRVPQRKRGNDHLGQCTYWGGRKHGILEALRKSHHGQSRKGWGRGTQGSPGMMSRTRDLSEAGPREIVLLKRNLFTSSWRTAEKSVASCPHDFLLQFLPSKRPSGYQFSGLILYPLGLSLTTMCLICPPHLTLPIVLQNLLEFGTHHLQTLLNPQSSLHFRVLIKTWLFPENTDFWVNWRLFFFFFSSIHISLGWDLE